MNEGRRRLLVLLGAGAISGCALMAPADVETQKELLTKIPAELPAGTTHQATLLVLPPDSKAVYDTTQMAYERRPYEIAYFSRTEWGEKPSQMVQALLVRTLEKSRCVAAVVIPPFMGHVTHSLRTEIVALEQDFTSEPAAFQLTLRVQLMAEATSRIAGTREISIREPMREKTPYAGAIAANDATAKALQEVAEFVRAVLG